ncbi:hypothetical protein Ciccas_002774, partial [Cichlidogyrus casuarinus]
MSDLQLLGQIRDMIKPEGTNNASESKSLAQSLETVKSFLQQVSNETTVFVQICRIHDVLQCHFALEQYVIKYIKENKRVHEVIAKNASSCPKPGMNGKFTTLYHYHRVLVQKCWFFRRELASGHKKTGEKT